VDRCAYDSPSRLSHQHDQAQTHRLIGHPSICLDGGILIVLRQKTRCLFLVNLLTQYGHLGSVLAIATIKY